MERLLRTVLIVLGMVVLAVFLFGLGWQLYWSLAGPRLGAFGVGPMPMMPGGWGMHPMGWMGWLPGFGWLLGLGLLVLVVAGVVGLVRGMAPSRRCARCGSPLQEGWIACPRCGEKV